MNKQDLQELNNKPFVIDDLMVKDAKTKAVKSGNGTAFKVVIDPRPR